MSEANSKNGNLSQTVLDRLSRLRLGHEAVMLEDAREVLKGDRGRLAGHAKAYGLEGSADMGNLILGDSVTNISTPQKPASNPLKWLTMIAGLATGGVGLAMAPAIIEAIKGVPPVVQPIEDTDTNTQYELQFFED